MCLAASLTAPLSSPKGSPYLTFVVDGFAPELTSSWLFTRVSVLGAPPPPASCAPRCQGIKGDCCPTAAGLYLECCSTVGADAPEKLTGAAFEIVLSNGMTW